jgi:hypothetical protein
VTGPTPQERAERLLADAWAAFKASPKAGSPFQWQAAALSDAGLLPEQCAGGCRAWHTEQPYVPTSDWLQVIDTRRSARRPVSDADSDAHRDPDPAG